MDNPAIEIRDLVKSFPQAGSREHLIAVDMLLGMTRPDSGKVTVLGSDPKPHVLVASAPSFKPADCYPTSSSQRP